MREPTEQERRRRTGGWMVGVGLLALFVSTFTVPEALILLARISAGAQESLGARGVVVTVVAAAVLLGGGALTIAGFHRRRSAGEAPNPEDELADEEFGDSPVRPYDPDLLRQRRVRPDPDEPGHHG